MTQPWSESLGLFLPALIHSRSIRIHFWLLLSGELALPPWQSRTSLRPGCQNTTNQSRKENKMLFLWRSCTTLYSSALHRSHQRNVERSLLMKLVEPSYPPTLYQLLSPERLIYPLRAGVARKKRHIPFHGHAVFI